jgi:hypothetical protein
MPQPDRLIPADYQSHQRNLALLVMEPAVPGYARAIAEVPMVIVIAERMAVRLLQLEIDHGRQRHGNLA